MENIEPEQEKKEPTPDYNLKYIRKSDGKPVRVKRLLHCEYKIWNEETGKGEPVSRKKLRNHYEIDKSLIKDDRENVA